MTLFKQLSLTNLHAITLGIGLMIFISFRAPAYAQTPAASERCQAASSNAFNTCKTAATTAQNAGAFAEINSYEAGAVSSTGQVGRVQSTQMSQLINGAISQCQPTASECIKECQAAAGAVNSDSTMDPAAKNSQLTKIKETLGQCVNGVQGLVALMQAENFQAITAASEFAAVQGMASSGGMLEGAKSWLGDNWQGLAAGGALGAGGMALLQGNGDKDKKKDESSSTAASSASGTTNTSSTSSSATGAVDCAPDGSYAKTECREHFAKTCTDNIVGLQCKDFANSYCGLNDSGGVSNTSAPGLKSPFCGYALSQRFCENSARASCPTCQNLYVYTNPTCRSNPGLCNPQLDPDALAKAKNSCPVDPIFAFPEYSLATNNQGTGSSSPASSTASKASGSSASVIYAPTSATSHSTTVASSVNTGSVETLSLGETSSGRRPQAVHPDAAPETTNLFAQSQRLIQDMCVKGQLYNCR